MDARVAGAVLILTLSACSPPPEPTPPPPDTGRPETRSIEGADALGFAGKPIRKKIDKAIDTVQQRPQQLEQQEEGQRRRAFDVEAPVDPTQ